LCNSHAKPGDERRDHPTPCHGCAQSLPVHLASARHPAGRHV